MAPPLHTLWNLDSLIEPCLRAHVSRNDSVQHVIVRFSEVQDMRYSYTPVLLAAALSLTALALPPAAQAASTAASAYSYRAAAPRTRHARHTSTFVPPAATAQVPEVGDSSCHLAINDNFGVVNGGKHYTAMCGAR